MTAGAVQETAFKVEEAKLTGAGVAHDDSAVGQPHGVGHPEQLVGLLALLDPDFQGRLVGDAPLVALPPRRYLVFDDANVGAVPDGPWLGLAGLGPAAR